MGFTEDGEKKSWLLRQNGLHIELVIDPAHPVGKASASGLRDVVVEAALTAIQDCGFHRRRGCCRQGGGLWQLAGPDDRNAHRHLPEGRRDDDPPSGGGPDLHRPDGSTLTLPGRAVMLVRNVGHLMTTDAVLLDGQETPEGIMDAIMTVAAAMYDLRKSEGRATAAKALSMW